MQTATRRFALIAGAVLCVCTTVSAANPRPRPFVVQLDGFAGPAPTADPCVLANSEHGTGHATHLGRLTWTSEETVNLCTNPEGGDVAGQIVLEAANGDRVFATYTTVAKFDFTLNQVRALGQYQITGGTGRFAGARGQGIIGAQGSLLPPFEVIGGLAGTIAF